jgi:CTP synthase
MATKQRTKYIFVVGGVMSGVGKGTAAAAIGRLLKSKGVEVSAVKMDPYVNVDAGTMNPIEHGEVFVTDDGDETDQDIGNYERFLDTTILSHNYMTTGRVYQSVINRERALEYGGKCVEVVPHVPEEIIRRIKNAAEKSKAQIVMVEVGGTVGEYQNILFLEAARTMKYEQPDDVLFVLVSYLPVPSQLGEMKTKPTQYASRTLNGAGIQADFILARSDRSVDEPRKKKMSVLCNVHADDIISSPNVNSVYEVPVVYDDQKLAQKILKKLNITARKNDFEQWRQWTQEIGNYKKEVHIGVLGKYFNSGDFIVSDVYISVIEALKHAAWANKRKPVLTWLNSEDYEKDPRKLKELAKFDGILVPGGFGSRGVEGIISAIEYVRHHKIPYFGICYGMQLATIEFARHACALRDANTTEIDPKTQHPVIHIMSDQEKAMLENNYGGTMRLGAYPCLLTPKTLSSKAYGQTDISERHRHRYEFNNDYREQLQAKGLVIGGTSPDGHLVEIVELPTDKHPFFVGVQFHPEFKSRPQSPHPIFRDFIKASVKNADSKK